MTLVFTNQKTGEQTTFHHVQSVWKGAARTRIGLRVVPALKFVVSEHSNQWDEKVMSLRDYTFKVYGV